MVELAAFSQLRTLDPEERLFRHKLRPSWGVGLWVREEKSRRRFVFQDGSQRAFRVGFYHLLEAVEPEEAEADEIEEILDNLIGDVEMHTMEEDIDERPAAMTFDEQIEVFLRLFPEGFQGKKYRNKYRAPKSGSSRKSHIDPVMHLARAAFAQRRFEKFLDQGKHETLYDELIDIMEATSVVTPARIKRFKTDKMNKKIQIISSLHDLLYGEDRFRNRFGEWAQTLHKAGVDAHWPMATLMPALMNPGKHICVKRSVFDMQARALSRARPVRKKVKARRYRNARAIGRATFKMLDDAGMAPEDMFDVRNFIWETLRPKGQKLLETIKEDQ